MTEGKWTLRDLESRNGTMVGNQRVHGDYPLTPGDIIRIAQCQLAFVHDLSKAFPESKGGPREATVEDRLEHRVCAPTSDERWVIWTSAASADEPSSVDEANEPTTITHRRGQTRYLKPRPEGDPGDTAGGARRQPCSAGWRSNWPSRPTLGRLPTRPWKGCSRAPRSMPAPFGWPRAAKPDRSQPTTWRSSRRGPMSNHAIIACPDSWPTRCCAKAKPCWPATWWTTACWELATAKARSTPPASSALRFGEGSKTVIGLIHLYSTVDERQPDPDDLEFTLAVADNVALAIKNLERQLELAENLSRTRSEIQQLRIRLGAESEIVGSSPLMDKRAAGDCVVPPRVVRPC